MTRAPIHRIFENLFLIDLDLPLPGFRQFISSWIITAGNRAVVIDPGPSATVPILCGALRELGVTEIDYILLTHIHLDHAGGCGDFMAQYPNPLVVCHPKAVDHLVDPTKLWRGSVKVLGNLAKAYGEPSPVRREKLCPGSTTHWEGYGIESLETPGHASHHLCFFLEDLVLAGEVAGVRVPFGTPPYTRPATPPPFHPDVALTSLSKVIQRSPQKICYGHYGMAENAVSMLENARTQINVWLDLIEAGHSKGLELDEETILTEILTKDPGVQSFHQLDPDIRKREAYFLKNSIKGMVGFIQERLS